MVDGECGCGCIHLILPFGSQSWLQLRGVAQVTTAKCGTGFSAAALAPSSAKTQWLRQFLVFVDGEKKREREEINFLLAKPKQSSSGDPSTASLIGSVARRATRARTHTSRHTLRVQRALRVRYTRSLVHTQNEHFRWADCSVTQNHTHSYTHSHTQQLPKRTISPCPGHLYRSDSWGSIFVDGSLLFLAAHSLRSGSRMQSKKRKYIHRPANSHSNRRKDTRAIFIFLFLSLPGPLLPLLLLILLPN